MLFRKPIISKEWL
ncbi:uncharacterized protein FFE2_01169 [Fusarium fujikuroi]|nr:uncharacterized protein FFE2_01169 [Fusarium fujikuroi]